MIEDDKFVGAFDIRHSLTDELKKRGGNVAYYIIPSCRKKGLASLGLKKCCKYAKGVWDYNERKCRSDCLTWDEKLGCIKE